jgi:TolB-like protein/Tfp pilus assembly protein PilF
MFTDMVGYTALGQKNEALSLALVEEQRRLVRPILARHSGREVKTIGDAFLVEFRNALDAVRCAYDIQRAAREFNFAIPDDRRINLRVGVHLGDIVESSGDISGDTVNVASRVEPLAKEGGVCVTRQVYDHVQNKSDLQFASMGNRVVKNVTSPIEVFELVMPWDTGKGHTASSERSRIVVLPLANISADQKDEFFADGMTDELISTLSRIKGFKVVARTSAMKYKGEKKTANEVGKELKVSSLLEGSVRRDGNRVRISLQLVDASSELPLWTEKYDRELQNVFDLQSEIAQRVADVLEVRLRDTETPLLAKRYTVDPGAFTLYLRGRYHWNSRSEVGLNKAVKCFDEAIARDPSYGLAYVGLADCYSIMGLYGFRRPSTVYPLARDGVTKALSLDPDLAEAHASMGEIMMQFYYEWDSARNELDNALKLNPNYATAHLWKSTYFLSHGFVNDAVAECKLAEELDPLSMIIATELGRTMYYGGMYDQAIDQYKRSLEIDSSFALAHKGLAEVYSKLTHFDESLAEIETAISLSKRSVFILDDLGYIHALAGNVTEARKILRELDELSTETYVPPYGRAAIYAGIGDSEKAMEWLEKAYEERSFLTWIKVDPVFEHLRGDSRFENLLEKLGFGQH